MGPDAGPVRDTDWDGVRLHIVTGKGGTGKTTVAAALAFALASEGRRVLLAEVEGRQGISQTFDVAPLAVTEARIAHAPHGGEVFGLSVDAKAALIEYLQMYYKLGRAGGVLEKFGAIDFATTIAPGVRDVLLTGKVYEAVGRRRDHKAKGPGAAPAYDAVVLDAPPTGRVVRFLNVNHEVAGLARVGPIRAQADSITAMLKSPQTVVHLVTLLEEMPVQETVDTIADLRATNLPIGGIVVNQVREEILALDVLELAARAAIPRDDVVADLRRVHVRATGAVVDGLLLEARDHAERVALERDGSKVVAGLGRPTYRLPSMSEGVDANGIREMAEALMAQGMA
ncbi:MAG: AAA family ATPase [Dermatophilaceae bacterium]|nr:AAA family ATPase [Dermatophilaceae bacterium]